ncbi:MAG: ornithine cyclodeaminase [Gammaproteobacteria bacterium]|nr:ornithine cyclodeaminase [Gammaproteobacteria bacterium]
MLMLDANAVLNSLPFTSLVDELAEMHLRPVGLIDEMRMESVDADNNTNHFFIRTGWQEEEAVGAKIITVFPRNNQKKNWPSIQAVYILFEGQYGTPVACLDGTALTYIKTATDSALGGKLLARNNMRKMLMVGAGEMALHLVTAHCQLHPSIKQVFIYNRTREKAQSLCRGKLSERFPKVKFETVDSIKQYLPQVDLVSSATASPTPVIPGDDLQPGTHVDLIGAFTPEMREADDVCLRRASIFVDARETTINHIGEIMIPLANGIISESDIKADFADLCQSKHPGRQSDEEITLFKNGGGGHLDLMIARILHKYNQS